MATAFHQPPGQWVRVLGPGRLGWWATRAALFEASGFRLPPAVYPECLGWLTNQSLTVPSPGGRESELTVRRVVTGPRRGELDVMAGHDDGPDVVLRVGVHLVESDRDLPAWARKPASGKKRPGRGAKHRGRRSVARGGRYFIGGFPAAASLAFSASRFFLASAG